MIKFTAPFIAAFQRPRPGKQGGYFSPHSKLQRQVGYYALEARQNQQASILGGYIVFRVMVYSKWGKKGPKQDLDNILKCCIDGCQGVLFDNDRQVVKIFAETVNSEDTRMDIEVSEL